MVKLTVHADAGSVRVQFTNGCALFPNGYGDGKHTVIISETRLGNNTTYLGTLFVEYSGAAILSSYDCSFKPIYSFEVGKYHVERINSIVCFTQYSKAV